MRSAHPSLEQKSGISLVEPSGRAACSLLTFKVQKEDLGKVKTVIEALPVAALAGAGEARDELDSPGTRTTPSQSCYPCLRHTRRHMTLESRRNEPCVGGQCETRNSKQAPIEVIDSQC